MKVNYIDNISNLNTNNFQELSPFNIEFKHDPQVQVKPRLICDPLFYEEIDNTLVMEILQKDYQVIKSNRSEKYTNSKSDERVELEYGKIYRILFNWMSIENWCYVLDRKYNLLKLSQEECNFFVKSIKNKEFMEKLDMIIESFESKVFVKLELTSVKHDYEPYAVSNADELFDQITKSKKCINQLKSNWKDDHYLFISEWNEDIKRDNELRVFIDNGEISGISQQYISDWYPFMTMVVGNYPDQILKSIQKLWNNIRNRIEYKTCVLDVYIELNDEPFVCHLIEINGYGRWGPAGSALFEWKNDPPSSDNLELRIRC